MKPIKSWNIKARLQSKQKSWSTPSENWALWDEKWIKDDETNTTIYTGIDSEIIALAETIKGGEREDEEVVDWYQVSYTSGQPLSTLSVIHGTAHPSVQEEEEEPHFTQKGWYYAWQDATSIDDYAYIHAPYDVLQTDCTDMYSHCGWLYRWTHPLSHVVNGTRMFDYAYMREFRDDGGIKTTLMMLDNADNMFSGCQLDLESIQTIAQTIKTHTSGTHRIGLGVDYRLQGNADYTAAINTITSKGWSVYAQFNNFYTT